MFPRLISFLPAFQPKKATQLAVSLWTISAGVSGYRLEVPSVEELAALSDDFEIHYA
jgi:hypothetical protein